MVAGGGLLRALDIRPGQVVAAVGAGGKTSLLTALAREFHAGFGKPAILTTTTRIFAPRPEERIPLALGETDAFARHLRRHMRAPGVFWLARRREGRTAVPGEAQARRMKLAGFAPEEIARLPLADGLALIEADGARRLPIKAPGAHEPVLPEGADFILGLVGLAAIGAPLDEGHAFRPGLLSGICRLPMGAPITAAAVGRLCAHPEGLFRRAPARARKWVILNKADAMSPVDTFRKIAYTIWKRAGPPRGPADGVLVTSCGDTSCRHGACSVLLCAAGDARTQMTHPDGSQA